MNIQYQPFKFQPWREALIEQVNQIVDAYREQGYSLTLRQVYYQFVSRDWLPERWADKATGSTNNERSYKNLGKLVSEGRLAGLISWEAIEDRTRELTSNAHWTAPVDIVGGAAQQYAIDKWEPQPKRVEIWVEKDALEGVIARPARMLDVSYFSCRGYTSQSAMHEAARRLQGYIENGQQVVLLHLGDHDPSGIDMTRDIEQRLGLFLGRHSAELEVRRIGLNMDQVRRYGPPPNPTKVTDTRAQTYIDTFGRRCWELDALEPSVIDRLITDEVLAERDQELWDEKAREEAAEQQLLSACHERWDEVARFLQQ